MEDPPTEQTDMLHCFLVKIALIAGEPDGMKVIAHLYNPVHDRFLTSRLGEQAKATLRDVLVDVGWLKGSDVALRFRLAVATAYVRFRWCPLSYADLALARKGREMLADAASEIAGGSDYAEAVLNSHRNR